MGVLEELRQQTNLKKVHDDVQKTREQIWQQNYENIVLPKMQHIYYGSMWFVVGKFLSLDSYQESL